MSAAEWDARTYHRVSQPQVSWGERVLARLALAGDETALDAGCGTGRLTEHLLERLPRGRVLAVDRSANMIRQARAFLRPRFGDRVTLVQSDLLDLRLDEPVDLIFSTATFHWITDHDRLFLTLFAMVRPGGRLIAQCGGAGNLQRLLARARRILASPVYEPYFAGWREPWEFADPATTRERLAAAGFTAIRTGLEAAPTILADAAEYREFIRTVIFRAHLERIGDAAARERFLDALTESAAGNDPPFLLDYVRLNLAAERPASAR